MNATTELASVGQFTANKWDSMQIPWREYVWLVLLLSLAIGLAVEQTRVQKFTAFRDEAARSERTAQELADQICAATNTQVVIKEFSDFRFRNQVQSGPTVDIDYVRRTDERAFRFGPAWLGEFDYLAIPFVALVPHILITALLPGATHTPGTRFSRKAFLAYGAVQVSIMTVFSIWMFALIEFLRILGCKPIVGAICLSAGAIMLARTVFFSGLSRDELENLIQRTSGGWWNFRAMREVLRFQLRDFFWLMLVIGLGCAVYLEHQEARDLSQHQGRAEWWQKAVVGLQNELNRA